jgi:5-methylcytosine-specific restriction endonuclease McrA
MRDSLTLVAAIALRDGPNCYLCNDPEEQDDPFEIEHFKPRCAGGTGDLEDFSNLHLAHRSCNRKKGPHCVTE